LSAATESKMSGRCLQTVFATFIAVRETPGSDTLAECDKLAKAGVTFGAVHFTKMDMALATSAPLETGGREQRFALRRSGTKIR
jgi:hypothetical protein